MSGNTLERGPAAPGAPSGGADARPAGPFLVLAAGFYDGLLCLALMFVASVAAVALNDGNAVPAGNNVYRAFLLAIAFPYFGWCWTRGGHTLGMRAWRLQLRCMDGSRVSWGSALLRYIGALASLACFGLGFLWMLGPSGLSWHDRLSGTRIHRVT